MNLEKVEKQNRIKLILGLFIFFGGTISIKLIGLDHLIGLVSGFGGALVGLSVITLSKIKKEPADYKDKVFSQTDERGTAIRGYAGYATIVTMIGVTFILSVIAIFLGYDFLLFVGAGFMAILIFSFFAFTKYYDKKI